MSDTIARSSPSSEFSSELLPALTAPTMATGTPFLTMLPWRNEDASFSTWASVPFTSSWSFSLSANSTSSSLKSSSSSRREAISSSSLRRPSNSLENPPLSWFIATLWDAELVAEITSATASACARSILPFRKARRVNSPGSAIRQPASMSRRISSDTM